jgi:hypothetical protein
MPCEASEPMFGRTILGQNLVRRLALGSPCSKPSTTTATAEDGLLHPTSRWRFAGLTSASIAAARGSMQRVSKQVRSKRLQ